MKKLALIIVCSIICFFLSACTTISKEPVLSQDRIHVQAVEIYHPEEAYSERNIDTLRDEMEPIASLSTEEIPSFIDALGKLSYEEEVWFFPVVLDGGYDYDGYIVAIMYSDGGYDLFAERGMFFYSIGRKGQGQYSYEHADYCGDVSWTDFVEGYLD